MSEKYKNKIINDIENMSYTEFIGFINQWNVLPGAHDTLTKWEIFSKLNNDSNLLEIACTTGFSSRELATSSNCKGIGFDICKSSVETAIENKNKYAPNIKINYIVKNGYEFESEEKFSHIVLGAALKFFPSPERMLNKCINLLENNGIILASPFYINSKIPEETIKRCKEVIGIMPTNESYKEIMKIYKGLEIIYQEKNNLTLETEEELEHYCKSTINRACEEKNISDIEIYNLMYNRLYDIKKTTNELRKYQSYVILVLRYRKEIYPNRYVELF